MKTVATLLILLTHTASVRSCNGGHCSCAMASVSMKIQTIFINDYINKEKYA